jgi:hypothetical protein
MLIHVVHIVTMALKGYIHLKVRRSIDEKIAYLAVFFKDLIIVCNEISLDIFSDSILYTDSLVFKCRSHIQDYPCETPILYAA